MTLKLLSIMIITLLFTACTYRNSIETFEDIYTDVQVIKPTSKNYKSIDSISSAPIIKEKKKSSTLHEQQSIHLKKIGRIISTNYDEDVKLYVYSFIVESDGDNIVFYFNKKLNFPSSTLINVTILDNYLITATKYKDHSSQFTSNKKRIIKHKKRNRNIREAIEEKINTF